MVGDQQESDGWSRRDFLKLAGVGAVGATGVAALGVPAYRSYGTAFRRMSTVKNVVVVILDSLRKDHVGAYGNEWIKTPGMDSLAGKSLRFTRSYPESMPTIPARRAIHTGRRTWPFRDYVQPRGTSVGAYGWRPIPEDQTTLAEILQDAGYQTMLVTDTYHQDRPSMNFHRGFDVYDFIRGQENDRYRPRWLCPEEKIRTTLIGEGEHSIDHKVVQYFANTCDRRGEEDYFAPQVFTRAGRYLEWMSREPEKPFFMVVDSFDPHEPWDPPEEYVGLYDEGYDDLEPYAPAYGDSGYLSKRQLERMRALYAGEVTMTDRWLGHFIEKMEELGFMEDTAIVLLGDHGHAFGEHGTVGKLSHALWPELTDVPFLIYHPDGSNVGETSDHYASTHDVAPTVLGLLGIEAPESMDGQDLSVLLDGGEPKPRPYFTVGYHTHVMARDDEFAMVSRNDGGRARLYDLRGDPQMNTDIAMRRPDIVRRMFDDYVLKDAGGPIPKYRRG
ncbi:sulfatase [soil metagenome]